MLLVFCVDVVIMAGVVVAVTVVVIIIIHPKFGRLPSCVWMAALNQLRGHSK